MKASDVDKDILLKWLRLNHSYLSLIGSNCTDLIYNINCFDDVRTNPDGYRIYFNVFVSYATSTSKKSLDYKFDLPVSEYRSFIRLSKIESILNNE